MAHIIRHTKIWSSYFNKNNNNIHSEAQTEQKYAASNIYMPKKTKF